MPALCVWKEACPWWTIFTTNACTMCVKGSLSMMDHLHYECLHYVCERKPVHDGPSSLRMPALCVWKEACPWWTIFTTNACTMCVKGSLSMMDHLHYECLHYVCERKPVHDGPSSLRMPALCVWKEACPWWTIFTTNACTMCVKGSLSMMDHLHYECLHYVCERKPVHDGPSFTTNACTMCVKGSLSMMDHLHYECLHYVCERKPVHDGPSSLLMPALCVWKEACPWWTIFTTNACTMCVKGSLSMMDHLHYECLHYVCYLGSSGQQCPFRWLSSQSFWGNLCIVAHTANLPTHPSQSNMKHLHSLHYSSNSIFHQA